MLLQSAELRVMRSVQENQGAATWNAMRRKAAVWHLENVIYITDLTNICGRRMI